MDRSLLKELRAEFLKTVSSDYWEEVMYDCPVEYRTYMALDEAMQKDERCNGIMLREKLKSLRFVCRPGEPLVGRLVTSEGVTAEERKKGRQFFSDREEHWGAAGGQSGHCAPAYDKILRGGLDGLRAEVKQTIHGTPTVFQENILQALIGFEAMIGHAADAAEAAGNAEVAQICRKLRHEPPANFHEALQLILLTQIAIEKGERSYLINPGRLDRILAPYLPVESQDDMATLIGFFYLAINWNAPTGLAYGLMICGETPVNEISYACLEACRLCNLSYPTVGVCVNENTPDDIQRLAVDIIAEGNPNPAFFNDTTIRKGLESYGVPKEDSSDYINSTCVEITPCGKSNVYVASPYFNLCHHLLEAMTEEYPTFEAFVEAFKNKLAAQIKAAAEGQQGIRDKRARWKRRPLQSLFTDDCLKNGLDIEVGGARYNWIECSFVGMANLVDSLTVIRQVVFADKRLTMAQLRELCENDFQNAEALRQEFLHKYPKYGHGNEEVDGVIPSIISFVRGELAKYHFTPGDSPWLPGTFCWVMHQRLGEQTCATPDGRRAGFPFADGAGPAQGREIFGPTTAIQSVTSWNHSPLIGGCAFNMKFSKSSFDAADARQKLLALVQTFLRRGGFETQINVVDSQTLVEADRHPEDYPDLMVRIGGYSDYFARLSPKMRQEIIMRTQNEI